MKKEFTINYVPHWNKDGTYYDQTINIKTNTLRKLKDILQSEVTLPKYKKDDYLARLYLKNSFGNIENGFVFMNLTQRDFFNKFLKLKLHSYRNTCFCIIDYKPKKITG